LVEPTKTNYQKQYFPTVKVKQTNVSAFGICDLPSSRKFVRITKKAPKKIQRPKNILSEFFWQNAPKLYFRGAVLFITGADVCDPTGRKVLPRTGKSDTNLHSSGPGMLQSFTKSITPKFKTLFYICMSL
jgi:hypothetical protein